MSVWVATAMEWVTEQVCHATPFPVGPAPAFTVVVTEALVAQVVAEAEVLCAAAAAVEEVLV
jgi:hypothetical protein